MSSSASFRRHQALLQLFSHRQLRDSLSLAPQPSLRIALVAALQAALAVLVELAMARFSPWPQLVGYPALGALAALFGRFAPVEKRMRIVALCAVLLALAVFIPSLASLAGAPPWAMMVVLALIAGGSTLVVSRWQLGGPGAGHPCVCGRRFAGTRCHLGGAGRAYPGRCGRGHRGLPRVWRHRLDASY